MSSDESTSTNISIFSNRAENQTPLKAQKPEKCEIDLVGNFLLDLYHRSVVSAKDDWCCNKSEIRKKFVQFVTADLKDKLKEVNCTPYDIGTLLHRCGFLINTTRGSSVYRIRYKALFDFRNNKIKELDDFKINYDGIQQDIKNKIGSNTNLEKNSDALGENNLVIAENEPKILLEYQGTTIQRRKQNYYPTNMSCVVCQIDFSSMDAFEDHIQIHVEDTDFEFVTNLDKNDTPIFTVKYALCKDSHYFCFELETTLEKLIIEKIIIVQSRSFFYVHNMRVPYNYPESGVDRFFVDSHLFTIHVEQPIILIAHLENSKDSRIVEEHHFMRSEKFPEVNFPINPYRLPNRKCFEPKFELADYFPPKEIQDALKDEFYHKKLMKISNEFGDYVRNEKKLQPQTISASLNILLQIEDMDTIQEYFSLKQENITIRHFGDEYSFRIKPKQRVFLENILSAYDELILTTSTDILSNTEEIMNLIMQNKSDIKRMTDTYVGLIQNVNTGRISFKCSRKINLNAAYTIIFRPSRLNFRYQYRSLELLSHNMDFLRKFLFPTKIIHMPLSSKSITLYNENINGEQMQAVRNIAEGPRNDATYIVFGPPGTGKTTTLVESILQILKKPESKILVTASSNSACDEIALRLCKFLKSLDIQRAMVRIYSRSSEIRTETIDDELLDNSNMYNGQFYPDIEILHEYRIVICTLSIVAKLATGKFGRKENGGAIYTHLFIDEVAASTELEALMAIATILSSNSCLIISGDHKQLGPILQSKRAKELGLDASLMDRLLVRDCYRVDFDTGDYDRTIQTRLVRNYRSHPEIVNLYSSLYYNHSLEPCAKRDDVSLCEIWHKSRNKEYPILFHAIYEPSQSDRQSHSLYNLRELEVVMDYVKDLMYFGINGEPVQEKDIGIISPYKNQYKRIQEELNLRKWFGIETGSVETFQGKEKNIIIVSFVRSGTQNLGFLDSPRRLNVTLSRPKSLLILIGNPKTLSLNEHFEYVIRECRKNNTFVGANSPPKTDGRKQSTSNDGKTPEMLQLSKKMQSLNVANSDQVTVDEISKKNRRRRRRGGRSNRISKSNQTINDRRGINTNGNNKNYDKDDEDEDEDSDDDEISDNDQANTENKNTVNSKGTKGISKDADNSDNNEDDDDDKSLDNGSDKPATSGLEKKPKSSKNSRKGYAMRQANRGGAANSGKISKQHGKGRQQNMVDKNLNLDKNKLDSLFGELPKVPTMSSSQPIYTKKELLDQYQQQYYTNLQYTQHANHNNPYFNLQSANAAFAQTAPAFNPYMTQQQPLFNSLQHQQKLIYMPPFSAGHSSMATNNGNLSFFSNNNTKSTPSNSTVGNINANKNAAYSSNSVSQNKNNLRGKNNNMKSTKRNDRTNATRVNSSKGKNDVNSSNSVSSNKNNICGKNNNTNSNKRNESKSCAAQINKGNNNNNSTASASSNLNMTSKSESISTPLKTKIFENTATNSIKTVNKSSGQQKNQYTIGGVNLVSKENSANRSGNLAPSRHDVGKIRSSPLGLTLNSTSTGINNNSSLRSNGSENITFKHNSSIAGGNVNNTITKNPKDDKLLSSSNVNPAKRDNLNNYATTHSSVNAVSKDYSFSTSIDANKATTSKNRDNIFSYPVLKDHFGTCSNPTGNNTRSSAIDAVRPSTSSAVNSSSIQNNSISYTKSNVSTNSTYPSNSNFSTNSYTSYNNIPTVSSSTGNSLHSSNMQRNVFSNYEAREGVNRNVVNKNKKKEDGCSIS